MYFVSFNSLEAQGVEHCLFLALPENEAATHTHTLPLKMSIPNPPQNVCPQSLSKCLSPIRLKMSIPNPPQNVYPQSPPNCLSPIPLKMTISNLPQNVYPQSPSKCLSPFPLKMSIPNPPQNVYPQSPPKSLSKRTQVSGPQKMMQYDSIFLRINPNSKQGHVSGYLWGFNGVRLDGGDKMSKSYLGERATRKMMQHDWLL